MSSLVTPTRVLIILSIYLLCVGCATSPKLKKLSELEALPNYGKTFLKCNAYKKLAIISRLSLWSTTVGYPSARPISSFVKILGDNNIPVSVFDENYYFTRKQRLMHDTFIFLDEMEFYKKYGSDGTFLDSSVRFSFLHPKQDAYVEDRMIAFGRIQTNLVRKELFKKTPRLNERLELLYKNLFKRPEFLKRICTLEG